MEAVRGHKRTEHGRWHLILWLREIGNHFYKRFEVLRVMEKGSYIADNSTYNILINRYGQVGFIETIEDFFQLLSRKGLKPNVVTCTSRIGAYSKKNGLLKVLRNI